MFQLIVRSVSDAGFHEKFIMVRVSVPYSVPTLGVLLSQFTNFTLKVKTYMRSYVFFAKVVISKTVQSWFWSDTLKVTVSTPLKLT